MESDNLPVKFYERVVELEDKVDRKPEVFPELSMLYQQGIEHFSLKNSNLKDEFEYRLRVIMQSQSVSGGKARRRTRAKTVTHSRSYYLDRQLKQQCQGILDQFDKSEATMEQRLTADLKEQTEDFDHRKRQKRLFLMKNKRKSLIAPVLSAFERLKEGRKRRKTTISFMDEEPRERAKSVASKEKKLKTAVDTISEEIRLRYRNKTALKVLRLLSDQARKFFEKGVSLIEDCLEGQSEVEQMLTSDSSKALKRPRNGRKFQKFT